MNKNVLSKPLKFPTNGKHWKRTLAQLLFLTLLSLSNVRGQDQTFQCAATVSNLVNTGPAGSTTSWFTDASGGTALAPTTSLSTGTYYVEQTTPFSIVTLGSGFSGPTGTSVQSDGKIIVADFSNNLVKRMNADGTGIVTLGSGFFQPISVAIEADGKILIAEFGSGTIKRMNSDGTNIVTVASGFNFPGGVTVQSNGQILVANQGANTVVRINADGTGSVTLGTGFNRPYSTAVQSDGQIVVADAANNVIKRMNADGSGIVTLATGFNSPRRVSLQADGKILFADFGNSAIKRINADGSGVVTLGSGFGNTFGVTFESTGKILVSDFSSNAIKRITEASTSVRAAVNVIVNATAQPTRDMNINGTLCNGATIGTLISKFNNPGNVQCYAAATGGAPLSSSLLIAPVNANVVFYLTQTISGCESSKVLYNAYVNFVTPPVAQASQGFCTGATIADLVATPGAAGSNQACCLNWYTTPSGGTALAASTSLPLGTNTYYVGQNHISGCALERTAVSVTVSVVNQSVTQNTGVLTATQSGAAYQWYSCSTSALLIGETNQTFTPTAIGDYRVAITRNGCSLNSNCITVNTLSSNDFDAANFSYYPNPTTGILNVTYTSDIDTIQVSTILGQVVLSKTLNTKEGQIDLQFLPSGTYLVKVMANEKTKVIKVVKN